MLPYLTFHLNGQAWYYSTFLALMALCFIGGTVATYFCFRKEIPPGRLAVIYLAVCFSGLIGARLFHVIWERPHHFLDHPGEIFTRLVGLTFYGAVLGGVIGLFAATRLAAAHLRPRFWDLAAILVAFSYGFIRLGCFANGCCWGKMTDAPWAVQYFHPHSLMPYKGIPVHPVQLYDALVGWGLGTLLIFIFAKGWFRGRLAIIFLASYGLGRIWTEQFRGDPYRGTGQVFGLSTSQVISIVVIGICLLWPLFQKISLRRGYL